MNAEILIYHLTFILPLQTQMSSTYSENNLNWPYTVPLLSEITDKSTHSPSIYECEFYWAMRMKEHFK